MIKIVAIVLPVFIVSILVLASMRPDTFVVERSIDIQASPEKIFGYINDFHQWTKWSPYEKLDPAMKKFYSGASNGPGAKYAWKGNNKAGVGSIEIIAVTESSKLLMNLDFIKPLEGHNVVEFKLQPQGNATHVTWQMRGNSPYVSKIMGLFFNMDKMIGRDFEEGLANLKTLAENDKQP